MLTIDPQTVSHEPIPKRGEVNDTGLDMGQGARNAVPTSRENDQNIAPSIRNVRREPYFAPGFTLMEMIVVILLLTILLGFAIPAFQGSGFTGPRERVARELLFAVTKLKDAALQRQSIHKLHLNIDEGRIWVTQDGRVAGKEASDRQSEWTLPDDTRITHVRFPDKGEIRSGTVVMTFYPQGYSDRAIIRLSDDSQTPTDIIIEAFLPMAVIASENEPITF